MKMSIEQLKKLRALCNDSTVWASVLDELISIREMKGEQVPVALVDERQGSGGFCLTQHGRRLNLQHGTELFTAPQKPVVTLPALPTTPIVPTQPFSLHDIMRATRNMDIKAIEAAGGIVSTSDQRLMQDMSGIVQDGE
ncbi:hypothetical protein [Rahnella inusitata]|uniref:hypothetical protein n=1 Tax=Rahnella inusitata TaxID=58169 RepID=UPI0039BE4798